MTWLWVLLIVYIVGFIVWAVVKGPQVFINLFWRIWTKQITATFTVKRRSGKVYTKKIGKKEDHA